MTEQEFVDLRENMGGVCLTCKERADSIPPEDGRLLCAFCDCRTVYGIEALISMDQIELVDRTAIVKEAPTLLQDTEAVRRMREISDKAKDTTFWVFDLYAGWVATKTDKKVAELRAEWKGEMAD
jgi:hypothetical protein